MSDLTNAVMATLHDAELGPVPTPTLISWSPDDPAAIKFDLRPMSQAKGVTWAIGRQLFVDALATPGTEFGSWVGDVTVMQEGVNISLHLRTEEGQAYVSMPAAAVRWVVNTSIGIVQPGSEFEELAYTADLDAEFAALLGGTNG